MGEASVEQKINRVKTLLEDISKEIQICRKILKGEMPT